MTRDQIDHKRLEAKVDLALRLQIKTFRKVVSIMGVLEDLQAVAVDVKSAADKLTAYAAAQAADAAAHAARPPGVDEAAVSAVVSDLRGVASAMSAAVPAPAPAPEAPAAEVPAAPVEPAPAPAA